MISNTWEIKSINYFENDELEYSNEFEHLYNTTPIDYLKVLDDVYQAFHYPSFDLQEEILDEANEENEEIKYGTVNQNSTILGETPECNLIVMENEDPSNIYENRVSKILNINPEQKEEFERSEKVIKLDEDLNSINEIKHISLTKKTKYLVLTRSAIKSNQNDSKIDLIKMLQKKIWRSAQRPKRSDGVILSRWNRDKDRKVFEYINKILPESMDLHQFLFDKEVKIVDEDSEVILCDFRFKILEKARREYGWQNTPYHYFILILKIATTHYLGKIQVCFPWMWSFLYFY